MSTEQQEPTTDISKEKAESLVNKLLAGKKIHDQFAGMIRQRLFISGKTMDEWESTFRIHIPQDNLNPSNCKEMDSKLIELHQEAAFYHAVASAKLQMIKRGGESSFRDKYHALVEEYKHNGGKLPSAVTLENLARVGNDEVESALSIAEIEKSFWSNILEHLSTCRKILENASFNNNIEARMSGLFNKTI